MHFKVIMIEITEVKESNKEVKENHIPLPTGVIKTAKESIEAFSLHHLFQ